MTSCDHTAMNGNHQRIERLPSETQDQIRSSIQICSLTDVISELVKNSLDANARHIDIRLDFLKGYCLVLDDGSGILQNEFLEDGSLAQLYCTSKEFDSNDSYGRYGRFLASLSATSLLAITSCHISQGSINSVVMKDGKRITTNIDTNDEDIRRIKHGTRVVVHNLFGQMPVRVKHRFARFSSQTEREKEFSILRRSLVGIVLSAQRLFTLDVRDDIHRFSHKPHIVCERSYSSPTFDLEYIASTMFQAEILETPNVDSWRQASVQSSTLSLEAAICLEPAPSKVFQFISLNQHPLLPELAKVLLDQINSLFDASDFGNVREIAGERCEEDFYDQGYTSKQLAGSRKGVDRWPIFYIRADLKGANYRMEGSIDSKVDQVLVSMSGLLHALLVEFLQASGFRVRQQRNPTNRRTQLSSVRSDSTYNFSNFDTWSRIKSGNGVPIDLLSGLPFMCRKQSKTRFPESVVHTRMECEPDNLTLQESAVKWTNPRTGNTLHINSRTGMVLPSNVNGTTSASTVSKCTHQSRKLGDIVSSLRQYLPSSRVEQAVKSIVPDYEQPKGRTHIFNTSERASILDIPETLHIGGPNSVEPACLNITRANLKTANVLGQVDKKFILASVILDDDRCTVLILIDQHAADERIKVEELFQRLCNNKAVLLTTPITFEVNPQEIHRFRQSRSYFAEWEIHYSISEDQIRVSAVPELIVERCCSEPKLLINLLRNEVWRERLNATRSVKGNDWLSTMGASPYGIRDMVASRACRSAVMFNDELTTEQCQDLVDGLSQCLFPFQCAHGRPSLTALAQFREADSSDEMEMKEASFGKGWKAWVDPTPDWS